MSKSFIFEHVKLLKVLDGDTIDVDIDVGFGFKAENKRIRINKIDAPETRTRNKSEKQAGLLVKQYVINILNAVNIKIISETICGTYGQRIMGDIILDLGTGEELLSNHLLRMKYARIYIPKVNRKRVSWKKNSLKYIIKKLKDKKYDN